MRAFPESYIFSFVDNLLSILLLFDHWVGREAHGVNQYIIRNHGMPIGGGFVYVPRIRLTKRPCKIRQTSLRPDLSTAMFIHKKHL